MGNLTDVRVHFISFALVRNFGAHLPRLVITVRTSVNTASSRAMITPQFSPWTFSKQNLKQSANNCTDIFSCTPEYHVAFCTQHTFSRV